MALYESVLMWDVVQDYNYPCEKSNKQFDLKNNSLLKKISLDTQGMKIFYHKLFSHENIQ